MPIQETVTAFTLNVKGFSGFLKATSFLDRVLLTSFGTRNNRSDDPGLFCQTVLEISLAKPHGKVYLFIPFFDNLQGKQAARGRLLVFTRKGDITCKADKQKDG